MSRRKRRFSNVYTPDLSKSFKYMYEDIPDIQTGFGLEDRMDVEWLQGIPWGIIDAWIQNQNYIIWLELFEIVEESNTNILKSLQDRADKHAHPPESTPIEETKLYICFKILKLKTLYKLTMMLILLKIIDIWHACQ